jgi:GrpB-like predicted nucleotidyltransferase (UPF0157 family)
MPPPIPVKLHQHDRRWAAVAEAEGARLANATTAILEVHHIGSTAIPGLLAKPIIDLLGVATSLADLDRERAAIEALGYTWHGEYGLAERRYCTLSDTETGERLVQLHCYPQGEFSIRRHLLFRDYLRARPEFAAAYEREKKRCAELYPNDSHAYGACKAMWIEQVEDQAIKAA